MKKQTKFGVLVEMKNRCEERGIRAHVAGDAEMKRFWQAAAEGYWRRAMRLTAGQCDQFM